jgi:hypothetical protein
VTELSALVVLRPAGGGELGDQGPITSENVAASLPSERAVALATEHFRARGFEVTPAIGPSFSIVAPQERFEEVFGVKLDEQALARGLELPLESLPADLASVVQAVVITPPPDFGPTDYR